jgi:hypothetical protein
MNTPNPANGRTPRRQRLDAYERALNRWSAPLRPFASVCAGSWKAGLLGDAAAGFPRH